MACHHPPLPNKPGKHNWVEEHGGLPEAIDCTARAVYHEGASKGDVGRAIAIAVEQSKRICATGRARVGGTVNAKDRARHCAAIQKWERMKAAARAD